jgi:hypothetical protein
VRLRRGTFLFRFLMAMSVALGVVTPVLVLLSLVFAVGLFAGSAGPGHADVTLSNTPFPFVVPLFAMNYPGVAAAKSVHVENALLLLGLAVADLIFWCILLSAVVGVVVAAAWPRRPASPPA